MTPEWITFRVTVDAFRADYVNGKYEPLAKSVEEAMPAFEHYRKIAICAICRQPLEYGDLWTFVPTQTPAESGSRTVEASPVHKECWEHEYDNV